MSSEQPERLYVEREVLGRPFGPKLSHFRLGYRVIAAIDLDERKLRRVVAQPLFRRIGLGGIEATRRDQTLVGP